MSSIRFTSLFVGMTLVGCADLTKKAIEAEVPRPKPELARVAEASQNEPGSLWTEQSRWNELYSLPSSRAVGDLLFIRPSENFLALVSRKGGRVPASVGNAAAASPRGGDWVVVSIQEILPRQVYSISSPRVNWGSDAQEISLRGRVREQDIAADGTLSSDYVHHLNLDVRTLKEEKVAEANVAPENEDGKESEVTNQEEKKRKEEPRREKRE